MPMDTHLGALIQDFISSDDPAISERALTELLAEHAEPQIRRMLHRKLTFAGFREQQELEDLCSEVLSELLYRLRRLRDEHSAHGIENFASYTSVTTYRVYSEYLRWKYPQRHRLKTQLRYLFHSDGRFIMWETEQHTWLCGLRAWSVLTRQHRTTPTFEKLSELPEKLFSGNSSPGDFIAGILAYLNAPVELNDLVGIVAELWGIQDHAAASLDENSPLHLTNGTPMTSLELRNWLSCLWREITWLPLAQRHALLLNLRDDREEPALMLVPLAGIASIGQIAEVLELTEGEMASLWNRLPIDDLTIAGRLGVTRQQVINLRKSARARLSRRMSASW